MKNFSIFAAVAASVSCSTAFAADVTFNFVVNSSGADLYPCDAGLYNPNGPQSFLTGSITPYVGHQVTPTWDDRSLLANTSLTNFRTLFYNTGYSDSSVIQKLSNVVYNPYITSPGSQAPALRELKFNLTSEFYTGKYFVDFCYRGPNLGYLSSNYNYELHDMITGYDFVSNDYLVHAGVKVTGKLVCDSRQTTASTDFNSTQIDDNFSAGLVDSLHGNGAGTVAAESSPTDTLMSASGQSVFADVSDPLDIQTVGAPAKYCVIRYVFSELSGARRQWDPLSARFTIHLDLQAKTTSL